MSLQPVSLYKRFLLYIGKRFFLIKNLNTERFMNARVTRVALYMLLRRYNGTGGERAANPRSVCRVEELPNVDDNDATMLKR